MRVILSNPDNALKPGMFGRVKFVTQTFAGVNVVPREAVQIGKDGKFVTTVDSRLGMPGVIGFDGVRLCPAAQQEGQAAAD